MKKIIKRVIGLVFVVVVLVNIGVYTTTHSAKYYQNQTQKKTTSPEMKYLAYCEGGQSDILVKKTDETCLADYPGSLARKVVPIMSLFMLLILAGLFLSLRFCCLKKSEARKAD